MNRHQMRRFKQESGRDECERALGVCSHGVKGHVISTEKVYVSRIVPFGAKNLLDKAAPVLNKG